MRGGRSAAGLSLAELMVYVAILGTIAVMIAPVERFLIRALRIAGPAPATAIDLSRAATRLAGDVRRSSGFSIDGGAILLLREPDGIEITWDGSQGRVLRRTMRTLGRARPSGGNDRPEIAAGESDKRGTRSTDHPAAETYSGVRDLRPRRIGADLLEVTLVATTGETRRLELWLRNADRRP